MKKIVLVLTLALMGSVVMSAQPPRSPNMDPTQMVEKRVERLDKELSLTEEQKAEITKIYIEEMEAMHKEGKANKDRGTAPEEEAKMSQHEKMQAQRQATDSKIESLLTPDQAAKFADMKKRDGRREGRRDGRRDGRRGGNRGHKAMKEPIRQDGQPCCDCQCACKTE